jgi:uncharacterized membrane protein YphA (DoxX/SURF4 family)
VVALKQKFKLNNAMTNMLTGIKSAGFITILHWTAFIVYMYIFGYAALYNIFKVPGMMNGMAAMGFNETWTIVIGIAETIGVLALLAGIFVPPLKNAAVLWLMPFAVGAFTAHMCYQHGLSNYFNSLLVCILSIVLLLTDKRFSMTL